MYNAGCPLYQKCRRKEKIEITVVDVFLAGATNGGRKQHSGQVAQVNFS